MFVGKGAPPPPRPFACQASTKEARSSSTTAASSSSAADVGALSCCYGNMEKGPLQIGASGFMVNTVSRSRIRDFRFSLDFQDWWAEC